MEINQNHMGVRERQNKEFLIFLWDCLLIALIGAVFAWGWYRFYEPAVYSRFYERGNYFVIGICMLLYISLGRLYGGFAVKESRASELIYSHVVSSVLVGICMYLLTWLLYKRLPNVLPLLLLTAIWVCITILWSLLARKISVAIWPALSTCIIYDKKENLAEALHITKRIPWRFSNITEISLDSGKQESLDDVFHQLLTLHPEAVFLSNINADARNRLLNFCVAHDMIAYVRPNLGDSLLIGARTIQADNLPLLVNQRATPSLLYTFGKRLADIILSLIGIIICSPFLLLTAIAIKLYDHGPVLYNQKRLTTDGKVFMIHKFRSMRVNAESDGVARLSTEKDSRITPIGHVIRAIRFDELPQLFNILKGDMTIVGPRPERPEIAAEYEKELPEFKLRLQVKAGLTGYAQVYGKYNTKPSDKLQMDLMYIGHQSFLMDIKIIMATIKILFMPESTEGVADGKTTAAK